jgi:hypothetical protein
MLSFAADRTTTSAAANKKRGPRNRLAAGWDPAVSACQRAVEEGDVETAVIFAGEAVDLIDRNGLLRL